MLTPDNLKWLAAFQSSRSRSTEVCLVLNKLLLLLVVVSLTAATLPARDVEARFTTDKADYLAGEPVFVALTLSNKGNDPVWIDFKSTDLARFGCDDFAVEVPGAESAQEQWGCGSGGSCGRGLREVMPGKSISLRQLLNWQFRLETGVYAIRARAAIVAHAQNLFDSPQISQLDVTDTLTVNVHRANENELKAVFKPIVAQLDSPDPLRQREAAGAIIETAPPFLEDVLIELAKTNYGFAVMTALRKADTQKTRDALAQIATGSDNRMFRLEAIRNLGRTGDATYLPALLQLMKSSDVQIQGAAAEAVANLGGATAVPAISVLLSSTDLQTRQAGANGLEYTHAREAVPILIGLLIDSDASIRQSTVSALSLLTHRVAFDGNQWADVITPQSASNVHQRWLRWWKSQGTDIEIHGMDDCARPESLD